MLTFCDFLNAIRQADLVRSASADRLSRTLSDRPFRPSTDSRSLQSGEAFVCLRGPTFDGHDFIASAIDRGAAALVADDAAKIPSDAALPVLLVSDTKAAYLCGATAARRRSRATVVAVTGSVGKTTTKAMCGQLLEKHRRAIASERNENNELGVAKLCYSLDDSVDVAVVEMGARGPGQIEELVGIASPEVGILTNIGESHLEFFEDRAELARTKFAIFGKGARPVLNAADEWSRTLAASARIDRAGLWVRLCGDPPCEGLALEAGSPRDGRVALTFGSSHAYAKWHLIGEHHLRDALLAAAGAILAGLTFEESIEGFDALRLPPGRFEMHTTRTGAIVVYDAYNASPSSMTQALRAFAEVPAARRLAVLGSMAELGADSSAQHEATGAAAARAGVDALYCGGPHAQALALGARNAGLSAGQVSIFATNAEVASELTDRLREGDAVLLKGSRVQKMEEILETLVAVEAHAT